MIPISIVLKRKKSKALKQNKILIQLPYHSDFVLQLPAALFQMPDEFGFCAYTCKYSMTVIYYDRACMVRQCFRTITHIEQFSNLPTKNGIWLPNASFEVPVAP